MSAGCRLYLVTPPALESPTLAPHAFAPLLAAALDAGGVDAVQLRPGLAGDDEILRTIDLLRPIAQSRDVAFLLAHRPDLALRSGCDGAHVDAEGGDVAGARRRLDGLQLGVSCGSSRDAGMTAGELGADYVAYGPFAPATGSTALADPDLLRWWSEMMELPVVAAGGITPANCRPLVEAGADFLAVAGAIWDHPDGPAAAVRAMNAAIAG